MRIFIANRYFYPDTPPYASMLKDIAQHLQAAGHRVEVFTSQPSYKHELKLPRQRTKENFDGVIIRRTRLLPERGWLLPKAVNSFWFPLWAALKIVFGPRRDVIWTATMPPVWQPLVIALAGRLRGSIVIYHMQDIYPEIAIATGILSSGWFAQTLCRADKITLHLSQKVVVLSNDMKSSLMQRGDFEDKVCVINNFAQEELTNNYRSSRQGGPTRFVFAGNLGRFQNLELLILAFSKIDPVLAELHFLGTGQLKVELQKLVGSLNARNVKFHPHIEVAESLAMIASCDVGVISLVPNLYKYAFPSKTFHILAAGLPILAIVEQNSQLAHLIRDQELGCSVDPSSSIADICGAIKVLASTHQLTTADIRVRTRQLYAKEFRLDEWRRFCEKLNLHQAMKS